jgi:LETM1 and EF-hand domain-containing protein 1
LTLLILEEALPFIVLYAPGLLPSTCLLPSQRQRIEAKRRTKQMAHMASAKAELQRLTAQGQDVVSLSTERAVGSLSVGLARAISGYAQQQYEMFYRQLTAMSLHSLASFHGQHGVLFPCSDVASRSISPTSQLTMPSSSKKI